MIRSEDRNGIRALHLEHGKVNAIDLELFAALEAALDGAKEDDSTSALVLTGNGRAFSAGVDLFRVVGDDPTYVPRFLDQLQNTLLKLFSFPRPVVAAIDGHAIAGGCIVAAACDRRLMVEGSARIGVSELKVGVPFPTAPLEVLASLLAPHHLRDLVLTGRLVGPEEAQAIGLVDEVVPGAELLDRAFAIAGEFAAVPVETWALTKRCLRQEALDRIARRGPETDAEIARLWQGPEVKATISAFLEKTVGKR